MLLNTNEKYTFKTSEIEAQREALTRQYYKLVGWSTNKNASADTAKFTIEAQEANVVYYAIWERKSSQLTYVSNGNVISTVNFLQGVEYAFSGDGLVNPGYILDGFVYNGTKYAVGDKFIPETDNIEIEVVWKSAGAVWFDIETINTVKTTDGKQVAVKDLKNGETFYAPNVSTSINLPTFLSQVKRIAPPRTVGENCTLTP